MMLSDQNIKKSHGDLNRQLKPRKHTHSDHIHAQWFWNTVHISRYSVVLCGILAFYAGQQTHQDTLMHMHDASAHAVKTHIVTCTHVTCFSCN